LKKFIQIFQVAFTYIGTLVGAGFASGREVLQFFTKYGWVAPFSIACATVLLIWIGMKIMLLANDLKAKTYDDLNRILFGNLASKFLGVYTMIILFLFTSAMIAGSGAVFYEQMNVPLQLGLIITIVAAYLVLVRGIKAIMNVNVVIIPIILIFSMILVIYTMGTPTSGNWIQLNLEPETKDLWYEINKYFGALCYTGFNLAIAQTILVPLGATIQDRSVLKWGAVIGGGVIGLLLLSAHFILSAQMPEIANFEVPMANIMKDFSGIIVVFYILVLFGQIFTTLIADAYGFISQIKERSNIHVRWIVLATLIPCFMISQYGFKELLSLLYPIFSGISLIWLVMLICKKIPKSRETNLEPIQFPMNEQDPVALDSK
jgi:uncharacterized membrane protein YkvI